MLTHSRTELLMTDDATPTKIQLTAGLNPDGKLHADGYFTWHRRDGYVLDAQLPAEFVLVDHARTALKAEQARYTELLAMYHSACVDASRTQAAMDAARMAGVHSVQEQTAVIVRAALELLEAVEGCDAFPPEKMAAFRRVFGA